MIGSVARRSCQTNAASSTTPTTARPTIVGGAPGVLVAAPGGDQDRARRRRRREERRAEVVDPVACADGVCRWSLSATITTATRSDGQVDVEDPAPREVVDEEAAEQRPGDRRDAEHRADQAHVAAALPRRDDVGDDRLRADHEPAGADALDRAEAR